MEFDFGLNYLVGADGNKVKTFYNAYMSWQRWHEGLGQIQYSNKKAPFRKILAIKFLRIRDAWSKLESFYERTLPHVYETLNPGLTSKECEKFQLQLKLESFCSSNKSNTSIELSATAAAAADSNVASSTEFDSTSSSIPFYGLENLCLILSIHDGQKRSDEMTSGSGMFGGYGVYDFMVRRHGHI